MNIKFPVLFLLFLYSFFGVTSSVLAQENDAVNTNPSQESKATLSISGTMYVDGLRLSGVNLIVKENGKVLAESQSDENGKFEIELKLDKQVMLSFTLDEYATKLVEIDTRNVPADNRKYNFYYKGWKVDMIPLDLGVDISVLKKPVALVVYNPTEDGFSTDKKYERSVRPALTKLADNVYKAYDEKFVQSEDAFDDYMLAVKDGDLFLKEGDYDNALIQYKAAKEIMPNETYPDKQIKKTYALIEANKSVDEQYASYIEKADESFESKNWEVARENYELAHDVKPKIEYPKDQIDKIVVSIAAEKELAAKSKAKALEDAYNAEIAAADSLLNLSMYTESKQKYNAAIAIVAKDYPKSKIKEIDDILASQADADKAYTKLMANANILMNTKKYEEAKTKYAEAQALKPDEKMPATKIAEADAFLAAILAANAKEQELAKQKEAALQAEYDALIVRADALMVDESFTSAKAEYEKALALKAKETYPATQIKAINAKLLELEGLEKQYAKLMANGAKLQANGDLEQAKSEYQQASSVKPEESAPKTAISEIDAALLSLAAAKAKEIELANQKKAELQSKYDALIVSADDKFDQGSLEGAKTDYQQALAIIPNQDYPKAQIVLVNKKLVELEGVEKQYAKLMSDGLKFNGSGDMKRAKSAYQEASALKPEEQAPKDAIASIDAKLASAAAALAAKQKAVDDKYNAFVADGDANFAIEKYTEAKAAYQSALGVKPKQDYPESQIVVIDEKLEAIADAALLAEKEAKALAEKEANYKAIVVKADQLYKEKSLKEAKAQYKEALLVFPDKTYPISQIADIDTKLADLAAKAEAKAAAEAALKEKQTMYTTLTTEADALLLKKDYTNARIKYQEAQKVFAEKTYPANQLVKIDNLLLAEQQKAEQEALLAKQREENKEEFDKVVAEGDKLVAKNELELAKYKYEAALKLIPGDEIVTQKMRDLSEKMEEARKLAEFHAKNDTEFNKQLAIDYPKGLNETKKEGSKTVTRIVIVANNRGDEYKKEVYSYGAIFYFKNGKKIDETSFKRETKGH